ncbi:MAG: MFS transporter [Gemmataceae bacterium]|nr:MFS transporter [Gemmataceae bacterium]
MSNPAIPQSGQHATHVRYSILGMLCVLSMLTYLDRAAFPNAQSEIQKSYGFKNISEMAWALGAFNLAYALFEVPTGYLGDVFGPKKTLIRIVLWWSGFTALTGLAGYSFGSTFSMSFMMLVAVRFLFGMGEAGAYPNITRALHNWLPLKERGMAQGLIWTSARLMGGLTPLLWMFFVVYLEISWRVVFFSFGILGVLWCVAFTLIFRNKPAEHPGVNAGETAVIEEGKGDESGTAHANVPWRALLTNKNVILMCLMYFCLNFGWYFNLNYLPAIMKEQFQISPQDWKGALYKGGPMLFGALGCFIGGLWTDSLLRKGNSKTRSRRLPAVAGNAACALCYFGAYYSLSNRNALAFAGFIALAGFCNDLTMGAIWATCQDIGQKYAAIVSGTMNMIGNLGGFIVTILTGKILEWYLAAQNLGPDPSPEALANAQLPGYQTNLIMFGVVYVMGAAIWLAIEAGKPIFPDTKDLSLPKAN